MRQLIHVLEQAVVLAEGVKIFVQDLPDEFQQKHQESYPSALYDHLGILSFTELKEQVVTGFEREVITKALQESHGNISQAARLLKMKRQFLQAKIKSIQLNLNNHR